MNLNMTVGQAVLESATDLRIGHGLGPRATLLSRLNIN